jgi:hypothetical protein
MTLPGSVAVNAVFLAYYALLLFPVGFSLFKHGVTRMLGFAFLLLFCIGESLREGERHAPERNGSASSLHQSTGAHSLAPLVFLALARVVGNALLIAAYEDNYTKVKIVNAGYILQGLGYTLIFLGSLAFYVQATRSSDTSFEEASFYSSSSSAASSPVANLLKGAGIGGAALYNAHPTTTTSISTSPRSKIAVPVVLHLLNSLALVLLVMGYTHSKSLTSATSDSNVKLDGLARLGNILFVLNTLILAGLTLLSVRRGGHTTSSRTHAIHMAILLAMPFMLLRTVYTTYQSFTVDPFETHLAARAVLQYGAEAVTILIYTVMGLVLLRFSPHRNTDLEVLTSSQKY